MGVAPSVARAIRSASSGPPNTKSGANSILNNKVTTAQDEASAMRLCNSDAGRRSNDAAASPDEERRGGERES